jgi:hypothetical protein
LACVLGLFVSACDAGDIVSAATSCGVAGRVQTCRCTSGSGTQSCEISGDWTVCECLSDSSGSGTSGQNGNAGSSGSNAGSSGQTGVAGNDGNGQLDGGAADAMSSADTDANAMPAADSGPVETLYRKCMDNGECTGEHEKCDSSSTSGGSFGGGNSGNAGYCTVPCDDSHPCPMPATGTAIAGCSSGACALTCGPTLTCPDTLVCANFGPAGICIAF